MTVVVDRNANKLQMLNSMPTPGDSEALDEFLAKFLSKSSQVGVTVILCTLIDMVCWAATCTAASGSCYLLLAQCLKTKKPSITTTHTITLGPS